MGKREETKKKLRNKIILASKTLFKENGFEATSIERIAEEAGVGLGTAYSYFRSKEELYVFTMTENIMADFTLSDIAWNTSNVSELVSNVIMKQIKKIGHFNKEILQTAIPFVMKDMKRDDSSLKKAMKADFKFIEQIRDIFHELKKRKKLKENFNIDLTVDLVFSIIFYQLMSYIFIDEIIFEQTCENIREGVHLLLSTND